MKGPLHCKPVYLDIRNTSPALGAIEAVVHDLVVGQPRLHHTGADERGHGEHSSVELDHVRGAVVAVVVVLVHGGWLLL